MTTRAAALVALLSAAPVGALPPAATAAPLVAGYERFHAGEGEPSAAAGAVLFSELGCANCHGGSPVVAPREGPSLLNLASRVDHGWLVAFLRDPQGARSGSTMPAMLGAFGEADVRSVAAFLGTLGDGLRFKEQRHVDAEKGSALYHEIGCVACHAPTRDYRGPAGSGVDLAPAYAVPLPDLRAKTSLAALHDFLANTSSYRPDGRMPHMDLGRDGAINVAAHLMDFQASDPREAGTLEPWPDPAEGEVARGRKLVEQASCVACHSLPGVEKRAITPLQPGVEEGVGGTGCLSAAPRAGLPRYPLTHHQRASLRAFLERPAAGGGGGAMVTLQALNCLACHQRDGVGGPSVATAPFFHGDESLGDAGRIPPPLTGIGHKLRRDWLADVLAGKPATRVRPYLRSVMPAYPQHAAALASWLAEVDAQPGAAPLADAGVELEAGRKLLGTHGGANCITCHHWGGQRSLGIPGLDIATLDRRLRPAWFRSYLLEPSSYRPGTLMPPLWPGGQSSIPGVLGGDTERQIAAIWEFIARGDGEPDGFPVRGSGEFELRPTDRPIVQRTFFEGAGTKAIVVGFPGDVHIAYDGAAARPALAWRGAFLDAYGTWFTRAAPFAAPLGDDVREFPEVDAARRFRGYQLDAGGVPTFLFEDAGRLVRERFEVGAGALRRTLWWEEGAAPAIAHPEGVRVDESRNPGSLTVTYRWP